MYKYIPLFDISLRNLKAEGAKCLVGVVKCNLELNLSAGKFFWSFGTVSLIQGHKVLMEYQRVRVVKAV
jgi:hypothetical protein